MTTRAYPPGYLDAVVEAVNEDTTGSWQTARGIRDAVAAKGAWGQSQRSLEKALPLLAAEGRIDYYVRGRYGPAGTRNAFLAQLPPIAA